VVARVDARNVASQRVARRLGLREEAHLVSNEWFKGEWTSEVDYALLGHEWRDGRMPCSCDDSTHGSASAPAHSDT
jgi:RimJ/RimL family protein N-acetyltransferase